MLTVYKTIRNTASNAVDGGGKISDAAVEVVKNTDSDHWDFLDEIEAPMWADLSLCNLTNNETEDSWFDTSHQFHQCSSRQLISTVFHCSNPISIPEPPSPKLPSSVSKSRGKNYKIKAWGHKGKFTANKQHPVKTLTMKPSRSSESSNKPKPTSNEPPKVYSSCESGLTNTSKPKLSKPTSRSLSSHEQEQEQESSAMSTVTSNHSENQEKKRVEVSCETLNQTSDLLLCMKNNFRKSCATRRAIRVVANDGRSSGGCKSSSSKSSVGSSSNQCSKKANLGDAQNKQRTLDGVNVTKLSQSLRNKSKDPNVTKAPAQIVKNLSNRQGSNTLISKVQQNTSLGKVLMPRRVNEQDRMIDKPFLGGAKRTASAKIASCQRAISSDKEAQSKGHGSKKPIGLKPEKTNTRSKNKDACANPTRKVYFR